MDVFASLLEYDEAHDFDSSNGSSGCCGFNQWQSWVVSEQFPAENEQICERDYAARISKGTVHF